MLYLNINSYSSHVCIWLHIGLSIFVHFVRHIQIYMYISCTSTHMNVQTRSHDTLRSNDDDEWLTEMESIFHLFCFHPRIYLSILMMIKIRKNLRVAYIHIELRITWVWVFCTCNWVGFFYENLFCEKKLIVFVI